MPRPAQVSALNPSATTDTNTPAIPTPPNDRPLRRLPPPPQTPSLFTPLVYRGSPLPPRWTNMKPAEKHFRCTTCQRGFTRIDHLKRHHLRRMFPRPAGPPFVTQSRQIPAKSPIPAFFATSLLRAGMSTIAYVHRTTSILPVYP